jgi:hypothetical protein
MRACARGGMSLWRGCVLKQKSARRLSRPHARRVACRLDDQICPRRSRSPRQGPARRKQFVRQGNWANLGAEPRGYRWGKYGRRLSTTFARFAGVVIIIVPAVIARYHHHDARPPVAAVPTRVSVAIVAAVTIGVTMSTPATMLPAMMIATMAPLPSAMSCFRRGDICGCGKGGCSKYEGDARQEEFLHWNSPFPVYTGEHRI